MDKKPKNKKGNKNEERRCVESKGEKAKERGRESQNRRGEEQKRKERKERDKRKEGRKEREEEKKKEEEEEEKMKETEPVSSSGWTWTGSERNCSMRGRYLPTSILFYA